MRWYNCICIRETSVSLQGDICFIMGNRIEIKWMPKIGTKKRIALSKCYKK